MTAELFRERLHAKVLETTVSFDGTVGLFIRDLTSGFEIAVNPDTVFAIGSSIKIPILMTFCQAAATGRLSLDTAVTVRPADKTPGSGVLQHLDDPVTLTVRDLANLMILLSDNTATNLCIDLVGMDKVNGLLEALGSPTRGCGGRWSTRKRRRFAARIRPHPGKRPASWISYSRGRAWPPGLVRRPAEQVSPVTRQSRAILKKPKEGVIRRHLPPEIPVTHKTGGLEGVRADVGIVLVPGRPCIFAGMTNYCVHDADGSMLAEVSRVVFDYLRVLSRSTAAGRMLPEKYLRR